MMVTQYLLLFTTCARWYVAHRDDRVYVLRRRLSEEVVHSFNQLVLGNSYECQRLELVNVNMYSVYGSREVNSQYFSLLSCIAQLVFFRLRFLRKLIFTEQKLTVYIHFGPLPLLGFHETPHRTHRAHRARCAHRARHEIPHCARCARTASRNTALGDNSASVPSYFFEGTFPPKSTPLLVTNGAFVTRFS